MVATLEPPKLDTAHSPAPATPECRVIVSDDRLSVVVAPPAGRESVDVSVECVLDRLREAGLSIEPKVRPLLDAMAAATKGHVHIEGLVRLAQGTPPADEVPAYLEPIPDPDAKPVEDETDHYHRSRIRTCREGQPVARLIPSVPGREGRDLFGNAIPFRPQPPNSGPKLGANVKLDESTGVVAATCDGSLTFSPKEVHVDNLLHVKGAVDFTVGNVDFGGDVLVDRSVRDLFEVKARNVTVHHTVEAARVEAKRNLHVDGGIVGKGKGTCSAGTDVAARFISGATVHSGGPITVLSEISISTVTCEGRLTLARGTVLRSDIVARGGATLHAIGSSAEQQVSVEVGVGATDIESAARKLDDLKTRLATAERAKGQLEAVLRESARLTPSQRERSRELLTQAELQLSTARSGLSELSREWQQLCDAHPAEVVVQDRIHPGVTLRFPGAEARVAAEIKGPVKFSSALDESDGRMKIFVTHLSRHARYALASTTLPTAPLLQKLEALPTAS